MPRVRLRLEERETRDPYSFLDPVRGPVRVPTLRVMADLEVKTPRGLSISQSALVDTGAVLSALAPPLWEHFEAQGVLERVPFADDKAHSVLLGGGTGHFQLGRVRAFVIGRDERGRPGRFRVNILAQLVQRIPDSDRAQSADLLDHYPFILGLHAGALDGLRMVREPVPVLCGPVTEIGHKDCGRQYGQEWYLETP